MRPLREDGTSKSVSSVAGGLNQRQPQPIEGATKAVNLTVDQQTGGWSTRVGYEPYRVNKAVGFAPYSTVNIDKIDSLFVWSEAEPIGRHHILFEANGNLYYQYEVGGAAPLLTVIQRGRTVAGPSTQMTAYTEVNGGVLVTNGYDLPVLVSLWPFNTVNTSDVRPFGIPKPPPVTALSIDPTHQDTPADNSKPGSTSVWVNANMSSIAGFTADVAGLGEARTIGSDDVQASEYAWQVSFVSDDGSEGPLSEPGRLRWNTEGPKRYRYAAYLKIPRGPVGTAARRIYRSLNYAQGRPAEDQTTRYFVAEVRNNAETAWWDGYQTRSLGAAAPTGTQRVEFPATRARFAQVFMNRLWVDGGFASSRVLYYSAAGHHEQFAAANFVRLSGDGGGVTGLRAHYRTLLVFRERGVDTLTQDQSGAWVVQAISSEIQVVSHAAVDNVPGLGVMVAARSGIYLLSGGFEGGSVFEIQWASADLVDEWSRVTQECLARAVAKYCHNTREFHVYVPADGDDRPSLGLVYHLDKQAWTKRLGFPVGSLGMLPSGDLVFGNNGQANNEGLHVISARRALGREQSGQTFIDRGPPTSKWKSPWLSMDNPQNKKQVQYVTVWVQTTGSVSVTLRVYKDWEYSPLLERSYFAQPADAVELPVLDTAILDSGLEWKRPHAVPLRVSVAQQSCSWFAFEFETTDDLVFVGWTVEYAQRSTRITEGKRA